MGDETTKSKPDTLSDNDQRQSLATEKGSTSPRNTKTYTEQQLTEARNEARNEAFVEAGRRYKPIEDENATLKSQLANNQTLIKANQEAQERLQNQIDELSKDDPDKQRFVKKLRDLESQEKKLKEDREALETERTQHADTIKLASDTLREIAIWEISANYEGGDPQRLKDLCDAFNATTKEQITKIADNLWAKKQSANTTETEALHVDSGATKGGVENWHKLSADQKIARGLKERNKQ